MSWAELRVWLTAAALVLAMLLAARVGLRRPAGAVLLALLSFVWSTVDRFWEGPVLWRLDARNSLVLADLVAVVGVLVAAVELWWLRRRPRGRE